ncbi:hypothetical protein ABZT43_12370 [Streptomyces sp. NPDC005349]
MTEQPSTAPPDEAADLPDGETTAPAHDGPTVAECTANDRRWWNGEKAGE